MKKILSIVLCCFIVFCCGSNKIYADEPIYSEQEIIGYTQDYLIDNHLVTKESSYYLGSAIHVYSTDNDRIYTTRYEFYPILDEDGSVVLTFFIYGNEAKLSEMFTDELCNLFETNTPFMVLIDENDCISFVSDTNKSVADSDFNNYKYMFSSMPFVVNPTQGTKAITSVSLGLPDKAQGSYTNGCWAACMASMIQHYTGTTTSTANVISTTGGGSSGKTAAQVVGYLSQYYNITANTNTINSSIGTTVRSKLNSSKALILGWYCTVSSGTYTYSYFSHMTICDGHSYANLKYAYSIMDPKGSNGSGSQRYTLYTTSSTAMPSNMSIYPGSGNTLVSASLTSAISYESYSPSK